jgi:hypothetical protein
VCEENADNLAWSGVDHFTPAIEVTDGAHYRAYVIAVQDVDDDTTERSVASNVFTFKAIRPEVIPLEVN